MVTGNALSLERSEGKNQPFRKDKSIIMNHRNHFKRIHFTCKFWLQVLSCKSMIAKYLIDSCDIFLGDMCSYVL